MQIVCNACKKVFVVEIDKFATVRRGDLEVHYFSCSNCGHPFYYLATDPAMRDLIEQYKDIDARIRLARAGYIREKSLLKLEADLQRIKAEQMKMLPALKKQGEHVLAKMTAGQTKGVDNDEQH